MELTVAKVFFTQTSVMLPIAAVVLLASLSTHTTASQARWIAFKTTLVVALALLTASAVGPLLLTKVSLSHHAFRVSGGLLLAIMGLGLLVTGDRHESSGLQRSKVLPQNMALFPLAFPLIIGPNPLMICVALATKAEHWHDQLTLLVGMLLSVLVVFVCLIKAESIMHLMGKRGVFWLNRMIAVLFVVLGVDMALEGMVSYFTLGLKMM